MKKMLVILYWIVAILLMATVLANLGYSFAEVVFMSTMFLPGALAAKYFFSKIDCSDRKKGIINLIFVILGIMVVKLFLYVMTHLCISTVREVGQNIDLPKALSNPVFISIMITIFAVGDFLWEIDGQIAYHRRDACFLHVGKERGVTFQG